MEIINIPFSGFGIKILQDEPQESLTVVSRLHCPPEPKKPRCHPAAGLFVARQKAGELAASNQPSRAHLASVFQLFLQRQNINICIAYFLAAAPSLH